jgi:tetratricopeptide (TPR) repeat protein
MTHLQISLWKRLAQVDFEENKFLQALSSYAKALRSALSICIEEEQVDIQCLYQGTMACVVLAISQAGYSKELAGPAINDTEPVDGLASALSVLAQFENNRSMESDLLQELADFVAVELQVKQAAWMDKYLTDLMVIHQDSGAYGKAAEVSHTLKIWESQRATGRQSVAAVLWYEAGNMEKSLEIIQAALAKSVQLDCTDWKLQARLQISAASFFEAYSQVERQLWQGRKQGISVPKKIHMSMMTRKL